eukprot:5770721-Alexandrium_andersonii.AAC.1
MSASLVGSEMCIRDRPIVLRPGTVLRLIRNVDKPRGCVNGGLAVIEEVAVSYTHLTLPTICSV